MGYLLKKEEMMDLWNTKLSIPIPSIDIVIFTIYKWELCVVLDKFKWDSHVLPWNILAWWFSLEENFDSILERKTWITWIYKEQLYTFWDPKRDRRGHVLSISYYALVWWAKFLSLIDFTKVDLVKYKDLDKFNILYDHKEIIKYSRERLKAKIWYTNVAKEILPDKFRITELRKIYEIILDKDIDKRNFQKKILKLWIIQETWEIDKTTNRPAKLYKFVTHKIMNYEIF